MTHQRYPKQVFWSNDDNGFIAVAPDLPGSSAFGESEAEALAELDHAIEAWIEAARAAGNSVPSPSEPAKQHSGKLLVRMPRTLHRDLANQAEREGVSLNSLIVFVLSQKSSVPASALASTSAFGVNVVVGPPSGTAMWTGSSSSFGTTGGVLTSGISGGSEGANFAFYEPYTDWSSHLNQRLHLRQAVVSAAIRMTSERLVSTYMGASTVSPFVGASTVSPFEERKLSSG